MRANSFLSVTTIVLTMNCFIATSVFSSELDEAQRQASSTTAKQVYEDYMSGTIDETGSYRTWDGHPAAKSAEQTKEAFNRLLPNWELGIGFYQTGSNPAKEQCEYYHGLESLKCRLKAKGKIFSRDSYPEDITNDENSCYKKQYLELLKAVNEIKDDPEMSQPKDNFTFGLFVHNVVRDETGDIDKILHKNYTHPEVLDCSSKTQYICIRFVYWIQKKSCEIVSKENILRIIQNYKNNVRAKEREKQNSVQEDDKFTAEIEKF